MICRRKSPSLRKAQGWGTQKLAAARGWPILLVLIFAVGTCVAQSASHVVEVPGPGNTAAQQGKHYVVLVSLDGFRYDYPKKFGTKNLLAMAARGASAPDGMLPSYPSLTFPNHYSLVTGLYPEHHGIVANTFYDPARKEAYAFNNPKKSGDGTWYSGTPMWVLAEQQGMRAATFFWPTSDAEIQGKRPDYYMDPYDDKFPDEQRIDQVLAWLKLPPDKRPHFITLYYSNTDHAGHNFGPDAPETAAAAQQVDTLIGKLSEGIAALGLPVDLIVVADHGMETFQGGWVNLDKWVDPSLFETSSPMMYPKTEEDAEKVYRTLLGASDKFKVYRRAKLPEYLHLRSNPRAGDPVIVPTGPYPFVAHDPNANGGKEKPPVGGHGFDPRQMPSMKAIFFAAGPDIRPGVTVAPFENVDVCPLIARILGLKTGPIDGKLRPLQGILKKNSKN